MGASWFLGDFWKWLPEYPAAAQKNIHGLCKVFSRHVGNRGVQSNDAIAPRNNRGEIAPNLLVDAPAKAIPNDRAFCDFQRSNNRKTTLWKAILPPLEAQRANLKTLPAREDTREISSAAKAMSMRNHREGSSNRKALPPLCATACNDFLPARRAHAFTESVRRLSLSLFRLIGALRHRQ